MGEAELLCLEGQQVVDPFGEEEALGKGELEEDEAEEFPIDCVELRSFPAVPFAEVCYLEAFSIVMANLRWDVMGDGSSIE